VPHRRQEQQQENEVSLVLARHVVSSHSASGIPIHRGLCPGRVPDGLLSSGSMPDNREKPVLAKMAVLETGSFLYAVVLAALAKSRPAIDNSSPSRFAATRFVLNV